MNRPSWDEYFLNIAREVSKRSTCARRRVGCVIVRDKHILTTGYNGTPKGLSHCAAIGCLREKMNIPSGKNHEMCRGVHAEANAFLQAAVHGVSTASSTLYCTNQPCSMCAKMSINAGVERIVISSGYPDKMAAELLEEARIPVVRYPLDRSAAI